MKRLKNLGLLLLVVMSLTSCANRYSAATYTESDLKNKTVAVLPYEVVTTGRIPENVTDEMLMEIEEGESTAFQNSMYHQFLRQASRRKYRHLKVRIQAYDETNGKLKKAGISIRESWDIPSTDLASILGVDAVVRSTVHKTHYLTDLESYGIYLAQQVLYAMSNRGLWFLPGNKTSDVRISTTIIDAKNANAIWSASRKCPTNWANNTYDVIERINYSISRRLPR